MDETFKYNSMQTLFQRDCHQLPKQHMGAPRSFTIATADVGMGEKDEGKPRNGSRGLKWKSKEHGCTCDFRKVEILVPMTCSNKTSGAYWKRFKTESDEHKLVNK
jgi:hypothetical protein